jgi:HAD superfamily hydrolase (TIGR01509 family)
MVLDARVASPPLLDGVEALIFDFDGTLFDLPVDWPAARVELGLAPEASITEWMQRSIDAGETAGFDVLTRYELAAIERGRFTPGAADALACVVGEYPTAVLTRNSAACVRAALGELARDVLVRDVLVVDRADVRRLKPDPEGVHMVLANCGVPAGSCLLVGDTFHDVLAAAAAGVRSAVVRNPALAYRPDGADYYLDALTGAFGCRRSWTRWLPSRACGR